MVFLAPGFLFASMGIAAAVVALHLIVTRQPRAGVLPTARFVPNLPATATARATRPSDLLLMLLRVLIVLAVGTALARPVIKPSRGALARIILLDVSRSSRNAPGRSDSARALYRNGDVIIAFDSSLRALNGSVIDSLSTIKPSSSKGNISGAIIAALRSASSLRDRADSMELVLISALGADEVDAATDTVRRLWPGRARIVHLAGSADTTRVANVPIAVRGSAGDPLRVTAMLASSTGSEGGIIVRDSFAADSVDADEQGRAVIEWPATVRPRGAVLRARPDTIGGVVIESTVVVNAFERRWSYSADSIRGAQVVARWIDGEPAAIEWSAGDGCVRSVAIPVTPIGDLAIRGDFVKFVAAVSGGCVGSRFVPMSAASVAMLAGSGGAAPRESFAPRDDVRSTLAPWLIAVAIAAAAAELLVRRRRDSVEVAARVDTDRARAA